MEAVSVSGFGGVSLSGHATGLAGDPAVILLPDGGTPGFWRATAAALARAGRQALIVDLMADRQGHAPAGWEALDTRAADLRAVLAGLPTRATVVAGGGAAAVALLALGEGAPDLATGLVLIGAEGDAAGDERIAALAGKVKVPVLGIGGGIARLAATAPDGELAGGEGGTGEDAVQAALLDFLERRAPRMPVMFEGGSSPRVLRDALGCFATGVTVVTSMTDDGEMTGLTANSFTSVSLDPPLILFAIDNGANSMEVLVKAGRFAINVLQIGQQPVSNHFAGKVADKFADIEWERRTPEGSPILPGSLASFDCTLHAIHEGGDHRIVVGRVHHAWFEPRRDPLLYFRGKYRRLHFA